MTNNAQFGLAGLLSFCLLSLSVGCHETPSTADSGVVDSDSGSMAQACQPEGTYTVEWTANPANDSSCESLTLSTTLAAGADGAVTIDGALMTRPTCPDTCRDSCTDTVVTEAACTASFSIDADCELSRDVGVFDLSLSYSGSSVAIVANATNDSGSVCRYTGTGTRR